MTFKKNVVFSILIASMFLFAAATVFVVPSYAASTTTEKLYFHVDPSSSYEVGTINTGGVIFNSTNLGFGSGNTKSGTTSYNQNWYLSKLLAGQIITAGTLTMALDLYASTASQWNYTLQIIEATSSGSTVGVLSQATCSGATGCLSLTTSQALYSSFSFGAISSTAIPAGDELQVSFSISESSGTNSVNLVVENSNAALTSYFTLPLSSPAVTINSLSVSPGSISSTSSAVATVSVSDAFGLYDLATQKITVSIPGTSADPISAATMTASSSNTPTSYTGTYAYSINPSSTSYSGFAGTWAAQSTVTDNSGNSYTSLLANFNYAPGGSCSSCTTSQSNTSTDHSITIGSVVLSQTEVAVAAILIIFIIAAVVIAIRHG